MLSSESDQQKVLQFARYTALAADKLFSELFQLSDKLEEAGIIPADRPTKKVLKNQLKNNRKKNEVDANKVKEIYESIKDHPDAEAIVASLFRDLNEKMVRKIISKENKNKEEEAK